MREQELNGLHKRIGDAGARLHEEDVGKKVGREDEATKLSDIIGDQLAGDILADASIDKRLCRLSALTSIFKPSGFEVQKSQLS